jgi:hypothetical protein
LSLPHKDFSGVTLDFFDHKNIYGQVFSEVTSDFSIVNVLYHPLFGTIETFSEVTLDSATFSRVMLDYSDFC